MPKISVLNELFLSAGGDILPIVDDIAGTPETKYITITNLFGNIPVNVGIADGGTIGQAAGPLITFDDTNNYLEITGCNVGIGTATPAAQVHVDSDDQLTVIFRSHNETSGGGTIYNFSRTRGTAASPALVESLDSLAFLYFEGYDGSAYATAGYIQARATEAWDVSGHGTEVKIFSVNNNTTAAQERISFTHLQTIVNDPGNDVNFRLEGTSSVYLIHADAGTNTVSINTNITTGQFNVDQPSSTGAKPVLFLDQGDVSEQCIQFSSDGADRDVHLFTVNVTGTPAMDWLETPDVFSLNKGLVIGDGGTTNYANFADDGELTLFGTARATTQIPIDNANLGKGNTAPTQIIIGDYNSWEYDINDDTVFTFHLPHDWATGTDVTISIDWFIDQAYVTNSGEVKWQIVWAATPHDASEPLDGPTHTGTADTGDINIPATAKTIREDGLTIAGASLSVEDQVGVTISRIALTDGNDPSLNVDPAIVDIHIQYIADKLGEAT